MAKLQMANDSFYEWKYFMARLQILVLDFFIEIVNFAPD